MLREKTGATPGISQKTENTEFRGKGRQPTGSLPYPEKETEPQKTNSIPFAKPIRRPKLILMIGISILPIFESFVCESQIKRYGVEKVGEFRFQKQNET